MWKIKNNITESLKQVCVFEKYAGQRGLQMEGRHFDEVFYKLVHQNKFSVV
jgi:hypothetical protein